jgi:fused signal recognition particle receptor
LNQAREFTRVAPVTGVVLTKLDGTAKGGVALAIHKQLGVPIRYVGVGEGTEDLLDFDPDAFVAGLLGEEDATG